MAPGRTGDLMEPDRPGAEALPESLGALLGRLRAVLEAQVEALAADDFDGLERLDAERDALVAALDGYTTADVRPADSALLALIGALDGRLRELARAGLEQTSGELREVHRGRGALHAYRRRGQTLIANLARLDLEG
jgi:hypothetical protein